MVTATAGRSTDSGPDPRAGGLRAAAWTVRTDGRGDGDAAHPGRRPGRDVDGRRGDRGPGGGDGAARPLGSDHPRGHRRAARPGRCRGGSAEHRTARVQGAARGAQRGTPRCASIEQEGRPMTTTSETVGGQTGGGFGVELNGINVIAESERKGVPRSLFWPWFAANVSVLAISYGSFIVGFGVSFWQATIAAVVGIVASFALCGVVALAGKRGSAPTMVLSRAAFGVNGNALPTFLSWVLLVGWETVLVSLASLGTATVFGELGWGGGDATKVLGFLVTAALVVTAGVLGFDVIMRLQTWITIATIVLTIG